MHAHEIHYERRTSQRCIGNAPMTYQVINLGGPREAIALNVSPGGIGFRTPAAVKSGTILFIRRLHCPSTCPSLHECEGSRSAGFAEVRWCREEEDGTFEVGAKYLEYGSGY